MVPVLQVGSRISDEARRAIYPELLKRLDDSSNKVRLLSQLPCLLQTPREAAAAPNVERRRGPLHEPCS